MKKNKNNNIDITNIIFCTIVTVFIMMPFILNIEVPKGLYFENVDELYKSIHCINASFIDFDLKWNLYFIFIYYFIYNTFKNKISNKESLFGLLIAILLTGITLIGKALKINNTLNTLYLPNYQILKTTLIGIGYFFIYYSLYYKIINLKIKLPKKKIKNKILNIFNNHQILISIILITICWLPIIIIYYPGVASGDTLDSLAQFFNQRDLCWSAKAIILKNNNVILNKHHSVLFTLLFGFIVKIGYNMSSYTFGMFLFILLQTIILILSFTFLLYYMKKINIPTSLRILSLLFICFCPLISGYTIAAIKDTIGAILIVIYNIFLLQLIKDYKSIINNKLYIIIFIINILLTLMIKSNSLFIISISYLSILIYYTIIKEYQKVKKLFFIILLPLLLYYSYDNILLDNLDITGTNKKESYSIPFMQLARLVNRNSYLITDNDKYIINNVLSYKAMKKNYNPRLADPIKNTYKKEVTDYELEQFWKVYFKYFKKYPKVYIAAAINSTYGYYFPEVGETKGIEKADDRLYKSIFKIKNNDNFSIAIKIKEEIYEIFEKIPFFNLFNHVAYYNWFLIFSIIYLIKNKKYKYIIPLMSLILILISSLISPVNGSFRYILAIVFSLPLIISINYLCLSEKQKSSY